MMKLRTQLVVLPLVLALIFPIPTLASTCVATPATFSDVVCILGNLINSLLPVVVALSLLVFFWGLIKLIRGSGDEAEIKDGKQLMIWGIIALFVMVSFVGIVNIFTGSFFGTTVGIPQLPQ